MPAAPHSRGLWLVAAFKLFKGLFLLALGIGLFKSLHHDTAAALERWADLFRVDDGNVHFQRLLLWVAFVSPRKIKELGVGTFFYSALMLTEGVGLSLQKRWAEYFSIIATSAFLPLEIYELVRRVTLEKVGILIVNIAVIVYLIVELRLSRQSDNKSVETVGAKAAP
jgi:uncharacterized membrane protein (DUF2068 family)